MEYLRQVQDVLKVTKNYTPDVFPGMLAFRRSQPRTPRADSRSRGVKVSRAPTLLALLLGQAVGFDHVRVGGPPVWPCWGWSSCRAESWAGHTIPLSFAFPGCELGLWRFQRKVLGAQEGRMSGKERPRDALSQ